MSIIEKIKEIELLYQEDSNLPNPKFGAGYRRERIRDLLPYVFESYEGDVLEIGCHVGKTTIFLCEQARKFNRKVFCIDPYCGEQEGDENVFREFKKNTEQYADVLNFYRISSQSDKAKKVLKDNKFCFVLIDGLHTVDGCRKDIELCKGIPVQAVDDLTWGKGLKKLFLQKAEEYNYESYHGKVCREGYYIKR